MTRRQAEVLRAAEALAGPGRDVSLQELAARLGVTPRAVQHHATALGRYGAWPYRFPCGAPPRPAPEAAEIEETKATIRAGRARR